MPPKARICVSLEADLLEQFDRHVREKGYQTRSEAVKAVLRQALVARQWQEGQEVAGAVALVYDHHRSGLVRKLMDAQHDFAAVIVSTQHVHLEHDSCLELVIVRGPAERIRQLVGRLTSVKGVKFSELVMATTGHAVA